MRSEIDIRLPKPTHAYPSESALQIAVVSHALNLMGEFPEVALLHSIPNGDWRGPGVAKKLKAEGVKPGIPDLCLPVPRGGYHSLYIELKKGSGSVRPDQWIVMQELHAHGHLVRLINDAAIAVNLIRKYLEGNINRYES
jgi:hypothetical protein